MIHKYYIINDQRCKKLKCNENKHVRNTIEYISYWL